MVASKNDPHHLTEFIDPFVYLSLLEQNLEVRALYLTCTSPSIERGGAHLIILHTTFEVLVAFLVAQNGHLSHFEDCVMSRSCQGEAAEEYKQRMMREDD